MLVYFAGYINYIGFYPGAAAIAAFEAEIVVYRSAKGSVQFSINKPLPIKLIKRIVAFCEVENRTKGKQQVKNKTPKKQLFFGRSTFF